MDAQTQNAADCMLYLPAAALPITVAAGMLAVKQGKLRRASVRFSEGRAKLQALGSMKTGLILAPDLKQVILVKACPGSKSDMCAEAHDVKYLPSQVLVRQL